MLNSNYNIPCRADWKLPWSLQHLIEVALLVFKVEMLSHRLPP